LPLAAAQNILCDAVTRDTNLILTSTRFKMHCLPRSQIVDCQADAATEADDLCVEISRLPHIHKGNGDHVNEMTRRAQQRSTNFPSGLQACDCPVPSLTNWESALSWVRSWKRAWQPYGRHGRHGKGQSDMLYAARVNRLRLSEPTVPSAAALLGHDHIYCVQPQAQGLKPPL